MRAVILSRQYLELVGQILLQVMRPVISISTILKAESTNEYFLAISQSFAKIAILKAINNLFNKARTKEYTKIYARIFKNYLYFSIIFMIKILLQSFILKYFSVVSSFQMLLFN